MVECGPMGGEQSEVAPGSFRHVQCVGGGVDGGDLHA